MPVWSCPKCGEKVENFGWGETPWKEHRCRSGDTDSKLPETTDDRAGGTHLPKPKKNNLLDFL